MHWDHFVIFSLVNLSTSLTPLPSPTHRKTQQLSPYQENGPPPFPAPSPSPSPFGAAIQLTIPSYGPTTLPERHHCGSTPCVARDRGRRLFARCFTVYAAEERDGGFGACAWGVGEGGGAEEMGVEVCAGYDLGVVEFGWGEGVWGGVGCA